MKKICKLCGKEFDAKGRQFICKRIHHNTCIVCGKSFEVDSSSYTRKTCSKECTVKRNRDCAIKRNSSKNLSWTNETSKGKYLRNCIICKSKFRTNSQSRLVCFNNHILKCPVCSKEYHVGPPDYYYKRTCSYPCAAELRARDQQSKYGVRSTLQRPDVLEKIKQTNLEKYGVENPLSSLEIRQQIKNTCLDKYGVEYATQSEEMKSKSRKTCIDRYGVEYASQSEGVRERMKQTNIERYGVENIFQSEEFKDYMKKLNQQRYGVDYYTSSEDFKNKKDKAWKEKYGGNPWSCADIRAKCNETNLELYGDIWPQRTEEVKQKMINSFIQHRAMSIQDEDARNNYLKFKQDPKKYIEEHSSLGENVTEIASQLGYSDGTLLYDYIHKNGMEKLLRWSGMSNMESEIVDFIYSLDSSIEVKVHDRSIIYPKELDIYLPEYKIGIECNPTITHNSTYVLGNFLGAVDYPVTPINYHKMKTDMCQDKGVFLFHIFGYEWKNHKSVILSMITNLLNRNKNKYYARNLTLKEVPSEEALDFLESNHRQGSANSSIRIGLYNKDTLVSLMTFGHIRNTIGSKKSYDKDDMELIRFCNLRNTSVIGGASKIFKYYIKTYNPSKIISFSDRAHTRGNLYSILGFSKVSESEPGYVWVDLASNLYFNRVACQKRNLPKLFDEPDLDIQNQTEQQIMSSHGFVQVFDSGTIRWEYTSQ